MGRGVGGGDVAVSWSVSGGGRKGQTRVYSRRWGLTLKAAGGVKGKLLPSRILSVMTTRLSEGSQRTVSAVIASGEDGEGREGGGEREAIGEASLVDHLPKRKARQLHDRGAPAGPMCADATVPLVSVHAAQAARSLEASLGGAPPKQTGRGQSFALSKRTDRDVHAHARHSHQRKQQQKEKSR